MRRALVLSTESAGHPFRRSLPQHVWSSQAVDEVDNKLPWRLRLGLCQEDLRGFLLAYSACLVAVTTFIA